MCEPATFHPLGKRAVIIRETRSFARSMLRWVGERPNQTRRLQSNASPWNSVYLRPYQRVSYPINTDCLISELTWEDWPCANQPALAGSQFIPNDDLNGSQTNVGDFYLLFLIQLNQDFLRALNVCWAGQEISSFGRYGQTSQEDLGSLL